MMCHHLDSRRLLNIGLMRKVGRRNHEDGSHHAEDSHGRSSLVIHSHTLTP